MGTHGCTVVVGADRPGGPVVASGAVSGRRPPQHVPDRSPAAAPTATVEAMTHSLPTSDAERRFLTVRCDEDLLALAPVLLGFWPDHDVVMLTFGADRAFHARVDLPPVEQQSVGAWEELARTLVVPALEHGVAAVVLLFYSDVAEDAVGPWVEVGETMRAVGIEVIRALVVGERTFQDLDPFERSACWARAYDVTAHPFVVQGLVDGRIAYRSRAEMVRSLETDPVAAARMEGALVHAGRPRRTDDAPGSMEQALGRLRALLGRSQPPSDAEVATVLTGLGATGWELVESGALGSPHDERRLWAEVLRRTPEPHLVRVASALGFAAWRSGDGAMAWAAVDRARGGGRADASVEHLADLLERAVPPAAH